MKRIAIALTIVLLTAFVQGCAAGPAGQKVYGPGDHERQPGELGAGGPMSEYGAGETHRQAERIRREHAAPTEGHRCPLCTGPEVRVKP